MFLEVKNIDFSYDGKRRVLNDISFSLPKGGTIAIVGSSGSGKSTLLRLISDILNVKNGLLNGKINIEGISAKEYRKAGKMAFMFQEATLMPNLSVRQNIELPLRIKKKENEAKVKALIELVGLSGFEEYLPKSLSGGMKTRTSLARSFITRPDLLLLDEPFSSLDVAWKDALYKEMTQLKNECNTTIVLVTHDINEAIELGDKIICLGIEGKILLEKSNTRTHELSSLIEETIIKDHKLGKPNEKEAYIPVA